jgi:hypothetical protein
MELDAVSCALFEEIPERDNEGSYLDCNYEIKNRGTPVKRFLWFI